MGTQATVLVDYKKLTEGVERIEGKINDLSHVSLEGQDSIEYLKTDIFEEHTTDLKEIVDTLTTNQSALMKVSTKVNDEVSSVLGSNSAPLTKSMVERIIEETTSNIEQIFREKNAPLMQDILLKLDDQKIVFQKMTSNEKSTSDDFKQILHCLQDSVDSLSSGMSSVTSDLKIITGNTSEILSKVREHSKPLMNSNAEFKNQDVPSLVLITPYDQSNNCNLKCLCPSCFAVPLEQGIDITLSDSWRKDFGILVKITITLLNIARAKAIDMGVPPPAIC